MKNVLQKIKHGDGSGLSILASFIAVLAGLLVGLIVLLFTDYTNAIPAFINTLTFAFQEIRNVGQVLYFATPLILTGLSVGFAMKTGLFNIGASGQYTFGAFLAIYVSSEFTFMPIPIRIVTALLCAVAAGAVWGAIPGLLKAFRNVHEVISCIMTNWIGIFLVNYIISETIVDTARNATPHITYAALPGLGLGELFQGENVRPSAVNSGLLIAIFTAIVIYIILDKTKFGFELKACGLNHNAAKYAGISEKRNIVSSMMISGALAGLGGGLHFMAGAGATMQVADTLSSEGFTGISVALLGMSNPIGIIFAAMLISYLYIGGSHIQQYGFAPEIIEMVIAVIIYFCAFVLLIKMGLKNIGKRDYSKDTQEPAAPTDDKPPDDTPPDGTSESTPAENGEGGDVG
jgi:simple sugar transport system permease protein